MPDAPSSLSRLTRGYSVALFSALILSTTAILIRYLTQTYHLPALILAFWRDVFVSLTLFLAFLARRPRLHGLRIARQDLPYLILYGLALGVMNALWTLAVALNGAAVATVLVYCSVAFTALLAWWFLHESLTWVKLLAVVLSLGGCILVANALDPAAWSVNLLGILTGVLSGLCYAIYSLMGRAASQRGLNPWTTLFYTFSFAALFLLAFNVLPGGRLPGTAAQWSDFLWLGSAPAGWGVLFFLAAGPTLLGFGLYNVSLVYLPSSIANLVVTLEPVFTALIAYFALGERLTGLQVLGSLLILSAVMVLRLSERR